MRIAGLVFDALHYYFMNALFQKLASRGHEVALFAVYTSGPVPPLSYPIFFERWNWFEMDNLVKFNPDRILMFNGCGRWTYAAKQYLSTRKDVLTVERGWLPQSQFNYIADGLAPHSFLEKLVRDAVEDNRFPVLCDELKEAYKPAPVMDELPEKFILYPCQLDNDTAITICAPFFKTNESLIGFLKFKIPDIPLVVKNHPKEPNIKRSEKAILYQGEASTIDLMARANIVVGNTSTCLCEALALGKTVVSFGDWIGQAGSIKIPSCVGNSVTPLLRRLMDEPHDPATTGIYTAANALYRLQWKIEGPDEWVADLVEQHFTGDRTRLLEERLK